MTKEEIYVYVDEDNANEMKKLLKRYNQPIGDVSVTYGHHYLLFDNNEWFVHRNHRERTPIRLSELEGILKGGAFTLPTKWCVEDCDIVTEYARKRFDKAIGRMALGIYLYVNEDTNDYWFCDPQTHYTRINIEEYTKITLDEFKTHILKDVLPEKWCIKLTKENMDTLGKWRTDGPMSGDKYLGWYLHTPMNNKLGYNLSHIEDGYVEITFEQFKKHILKQNNTVSRSDLGRIHNIACSTWKTKIEKLASRNPFSDNIELTQSEVDEMFNVATMDQYPILVDIFGEQSKYLNLRTLNESDFSFYDGDVELLHIRSFGEYTDKGFYLNDDYNWEIVKDDRGEHILLPTRK